MPSVVSEGRLVNLDRAPSFETGLVDSVRLYNDRLLDYAAIFRTQHNVRTVVDFLSRNIAQLAAHLYERAADDDRIRVTDHPFVRRLRKPNPADIRSNRYRLTYALIANLCVYDTAIGSFVGDHPDAGPGIVLLPTPNVRLGGDNWLWPERYIIRRSRGDLTLTPDQVFHLQGSLNLDDHRMGVSPIEALRAILNEDFAANEYRSQFWKSGARVSGFLKRPVEAPRWKPGAKERFRKQFREAYSGTGENAGGTPLLEDGMEFEEAGVSSREAQYLEARKLTREEVAAAYHVHPAFVGILEHANFSNMKEQHRSLYMDTLGPWLSMLDLDLTYQLLPHYEPDLDRLENLYVELNFREKLRGSFEEEADAITKLTGAPTLTRNEGRALQNRNALPGGDELITPLNVVVGGQTDPGEAPPGAEERDTSGNGTSARGHVSRETSGVKALAYSTDLNGNNVANHLTQLERFFNRQKAEVLSTLGAAPYSDVGDIFDRERWDGELAVDLAGLAEVTAAEFAGMLAEAWEFEDFDPDVLTPLIIANANATAANINATTEDALAAAIQNPESLDVDEPIDAAGEVFVSAASARAPQIAQTRTTWAGNFGRQEVARQSGRSNKVWRVTSSNPRSSHAALSGETVPVGSHFSNGMKWPGDPAGGAAEIANCSCILDFE